MKKIKEKLLEAFPSLKTKQFEAGGYAFISGTVVLVILILINVLVSYLPANLTQYDMTSAHLYSISSQTKVVVNALEKDVDIYWVCQEGEEDSTIENLLNKYDSLNSHLEVIRKDPDVYPTFASQYTSDTVNNNSIVVVCDDRYRYIDYNDIYVEDGTEYASYYGNTSYSFDGEGAITSAIDYVVSDDLPKLYFLKGHGESDLPDSILKSIEKENYEYDTVSLLNGDIPEDCDILVIYAPTSDISEVEKESLILYLNGGGHMLTCMSTVEDGILENFEAILNYYDVSTNEGIIIEGSTNSYAFNMPYLLIPTLNEYSEITSELASDNYYVLMPVSSGYSIAEDTYYTITDLLNTSSSSYSKVDSYNLTTYEKEEKDIDGPFTIALSIENYSNEMKIVWFGSSAFLDDSIVSYSSGANEDILLNSLAFMSNDNNAAISIRAKSLSYEYLTIPSSTSTYLKVMMIGIIPAIYMLMGITTVIKRRKG